MSYITAAIAAAAVSPLAAAVVRTLLMPKRVSDYKPMPDKERVEFYAQKLSESGVLIYEYSPGFMHFKGAVFDDTAYIGSYNFDFRSTRLNYENGAFCSGGLAKDMADDFISCLNLSNPISFKRQTIFKKLYSCVLSLFAPLV